MYYTHASVVFLTFLTATVRSLRNQGVSRAIQVCFIGMNKPESILESAMNITKMCNTTSASGLPAFRFEAPVVAPQLGRRITALPTSWTAAIE
jgi:hypothetical protein